VHEQAKNAINQTKHFRKETKERKEEEKKPVLASNGFARFFFSCFLPD